jgi:iron(III) transport system permease protein
MNREIALSPWALLSQRLASLFTVWNLLLVSAVALLLYLVALPLGMLLYGSVSTAEPGRLGSFTTEHYREAFQGANLLPLLGNTLIFSLGSTVVAVVLGALLAFSVVRINTPGRAIFESLFLIPLMIPVYISAVGWMLLLSPKAGLLNRLTVWVFGLSEPPFNIFSMGGMIFVEGVGNASLAFLIIAAGLKRMDPSLEEAAQVVGASPFVTFKKITAVLTLPHISSVTFLIFVDGLASFEVPAFFGIPARISVFTTEIYRQLFIVQPPAYGRGTALAMLLFVVTVGGALVRRSLLGSESRRYVTVAGKGLSPEPLDLGRWRYLPFIICAVFVVIAIFLPLAIMTYGAFTPFWGVYDQPLTLENFTSLFTFPRFTMAVKNTLILATLGALIAMIICTLLAYLVERTRLPGRSLIDALAMTPLAVPGLVLGIAILWLHLTFNIGLYGTIWLLMLAYITRFLPYGVRTVSGSLLQVHPEMEESAEVCGASRVRTFWVITLRLVLPGFFAGYLYLFIHYLRQLSIAVMLYTHKSTVLSVLIWDFYQNGDMERICALALLMLGAIFLMIYAFQKLFGVSLARLKV